MVLPTISQTSPKKEVFNPVEEHNHWCPWIQRHRPSSKSSASVNLFSSPPPSATALLGSRSEQSPRLASSPHQSAMSSKTPVFIAALKSIAPGLMDNNTGLAAGMKKVRQTSEYLYSVISTEYTQSS